MKNSIRSVSSLVLIILTISSFTVHAQNDSIAEKVSIQKFQDELNEEYRNPKTSPLEGEKLKDFKGHDFFPMNLAYRVQAQLTVTEAAQFLR